MNCYIVLDPAPAPDAPVMYETVSDPAPDDPVMNAIGADPRIVLSTMSGAPQPQNSVRITSAKIFVGPAHVTSPAHH